MSFQVEPVGFRPLGEFICELVDRVTVAGPANGREARSNTKENDDSDEARIQKQPARLANGRRIVRGRLFGVGRPDTRKMIQVRGSWGIDEHDPNQFGLG